MSHANSQPTERRLERLRPRQINRLMQEMPLVFLPLGAVEWHGWHAPVGLDSLVAHGLCLRAAQAVGGIVHPAFYYGMYATIASHPWTILEENPDVITGALSTTLKRLEESGVKCVVVYSGHFALKQAELLRAFQDQWDRQTHVMKLVTLIGSDLPDPVIAPDHGGLFETSLLSVLEPDTVDMAQLPPADTPSDADVATSSGPDRRDTSNPLFGIMGADPRALDPAQAQALVTQLTDWIASHARRAFSA
ncbi:MAG: creatininase family protein [Phycisphaerales bacterium JB063]